MMEKSKILEEKAIELEEKLRGKLTGADGSVNDELLKFFYDNYHKRFLNDNKQIWDNGKLMVPFSLSAFGFYATLECPSFSSLVIPKLSDSF